MSQLKSEAKRAERYRNLLRHGKKDNSMTEAEIKHSEKLRKQSQKKARAEITAAGVTSAVVHDKVEEHHMHSEWFHIPEQTIKAIEKTKKANHKVIAVGTTVTRTLEFWAKSGKTEGEDDIFIYPGFKFQVVDALLTNFHAPKSTVLMLASAFAGWDKLKPAYDHAIESGYQLLSYGDSMLIR